MLDVFFFERTIAVRSDKIILNLIAWSDLGRACRSGQHAHRSTKEKGGCDVFARCCKSVE